MKRCGFFGIALGAVFLIFAQPLHAQSWPSKPVKIVVAFGAGGTADILGRIIASELSAAFGQQFYVENKPGGSGSVGSLQVARAEANGYTLLVGGAGPHLVGPAVNPNIGYDTIKHFTHIAIIAGDTFVLAERSDLGAQTLMDIAKLSQKGALSCGTPGVGSQGHLLLYLLAETTGIKTIPIHYRSGAESLNDLIGGHVDLSFEPAISVAEHARAGKAVPIAVAAETRTAAFPNVPTFAELGFPRIAGIAWFWLAGPKGVPIDVMNRLNVEVRRIIEAPKVKELFASNALITKALDVSETQRFIETEVVKWTSVAKQAGFDSQR